MKLLEKLRKSSHTTDRTQTYVPWVYLASLLKLTYLASLQPPTPNGRLNTHTLRSVQRGKALCVLYSQYDVLRMFKLVEIQRLYDLAVG